ncbi:MAG: cob(I)yrinic acid a,c-diamide adenosyltransferase [Cytophagales bacterium]|nr:cob(I)yrinic acid a,c-diamide adenosyltransferase [Cytophagales bacterium]
MKIYTKTGDEGTTSLFGGKRVSKADLRIDSYGTIDELNSWIGVLRDQKVNEFRSQLLAEIQDRLFTIGSMLATEPENKKVKIPSLVETDIELLEKQMDEIENAITGYASFCFAWWSLPLCHLGMLPVLCRRAERLVIALNQIEKVDSLVIKYLNRLSDFLFMLCRSMAFELKAPETPWQPRM